MKTEEILKPRLRNMQAVFAARLSVIAQDWHFELVDQPHYANTGTMFFVNSEMRVLIAIEYDFQSDNFSIALKTKGTDDRYGGAYTEWQKWVAIFQHIALILEANPRVYFD